MAVVSGRLLRACRQPDSHPVYFIRRSGGSVGVHRGSGQVPGLSGGDGARKPPAVAGAAVFENVVVEDDTARTRDELWAAARSAASVLAAAVVARRRWWRQLPAAGEALLEQGIMNCRFLTFLPVAGSLVGSILCFIEGCFIVLESFPQYFRITWQGSEEGAVMKLLIDALDMFLVGTAMLMFGTGMYVLFVGSREAKGSEGLQLVSGSSFFGLFHLKRLPAWMEMGSVAKAKTRIGHSVVMILQAGVVEKLKQVPLVSALDLACFAGAILVSSACVFLLSSLSVDGVKR